MKRLLMATAAAIALAIAAPVATAQYTTPPPATAPYTKPVPDDPMTPQDESLSAQQSTTANQASPSTTATPELQDRAPGATTQNYDVQGQAGVGVSQAQGQTGMSGSMHAQGHASVPGASNGVQAQTYGDTQMNAAGQAQTQPYGSQSYTSETYANQPSTGSPTTLASLDRHARDAGMDGLPMTPVEVCAPREISLTTSGTRLTRDKQHQLMNAADRASVCELQRVVIHSPNGRADQARQLLVSHGVEESMIEVRQADAGGLEVEMHFAGIATSSDQYAQMFNPQQYASYPPSATASGAQPYGTAPSSSYQPNTVAPGYNNQPSTTAPSPSDGVWLGDAQVQVPQQPSPEDMDDGMSPTSGEPVVQPDMYDI